VASAIYAAKPAGIQAFGVVTEPVVDSQGNTHSIGFTRPTVVPTYLGIAISYIPGVYVGSPAIISMLEDYGDQELGVGNDVVVAKITQLIMEQPGVVDTFVAIGTSFMDEANANFVIGPREIVDLGANGFSIVLTPVPGVP
jgi:uncharacterized phage protein gp47/JayE